MGEGVQSGEMVGEGGRAAVEVADGASPLEGAYEVAQAQLPYLPRGFAYDRLTHL